MTWELVQESYWVEDLIRKKPYHILKKKSFSKSKHFANNHVNATLGVWQLIFSWLISILDWYGYQPSKMLWIQLMTKCWKHISKYDKSWYQGSFIEKRQNFNMNFPNVFGTPPKLIIKKHPSKLSSTGTWR